MSGSARTYILSSFFFISTFPAFSQERMVIPMINGEFRFDGIVNDECWKSIEPLQMITQSPVFGNAPSEKTEALFCYDNNYLYVGVRMFDSEPDKILALSKKRDEPETMGDVFMLLLDTFNDKENGLGFATNPAGIRDDFTVSKDAMGIMKPNGEGPVSFSWNTFWDVKTSQNAEGWFLEMRIPLSSLRFKDNEGQVIMGLICARYIARLNEMDIFPAIPPNWGQLSHVRPSKAKEILFQGIRSRKPFYIAPYAIGGKQWEQTLNTDGTGYEPDPDSRKLLLNGGLDVKYGLTNNLTMDITVNTDFAQVEADDEQINLTRFSLFFPEKRTFFQERSSIFSFDFEPQTSLFYSRRIGLYEKDDEYEQVPIYGGVRITGMAGKWDLGILDMQTRGIDDLSSENFGIIRARRNVINESSYIGAVLTSRVGVQERNFAYGLDGIFKIWENDYLNVKLARVSDSIGTKILSADPMRYFLSWERFTSSGLNYNFTWTRSGKNFDPGIGFQTRNNYSHYYGSLGYGWLPGEASFLQSHKVVINISAFTNNADNSAQTFETMLTYDFNMKSGHNGMASLKRAYENVTDTFELSKVSYVPQGKYNYTEFESHFNTTKSKRFNMGFDLWAGTYYGGNRFSYGFEPGVTLGSSLQMSIKYVQNVIHFNDRKSFNGGVVGLKALLMFSTTLSANAFVQYNSSEHSAVTNLRIRYNPREGNDFYIVFNEGRNTYREIENPRLPVFSSRSLMLKYTYTFTL